MLSNLTKTIFGTLTTFLFSISVCTALQNMTFDDQDFSVITYKNPEDWKHDPLVGFEYQFYNGSRSYTYVPGASASFGFTGSGIYLQGPYANDQALRRVTLDGQDMGVFGAYASDRSPAAVFWGKSDLTSTSHTVVVTHNDSASKVFAMDAWIVEFPESGPSPAPTHSGAAVGAMKHRHLIPTIFSFFLPLVLSDHWI